MVVIFVFATFLLFAMPVGATLVNYDSAKASTRGGGGEQYGNIPCSYLVPAPDDDIYTISITEPQCDVDIWVRDDFWICDRVDMNYP